MGKTITVLYIELDKTFIDGANKGTDYNDNRRLAIYNFTKNYIGIQINR